MGDRLTEAREQIGTHSLSRFYFGSFVTGRSGSALTSTTQALFADFSCAAFGAGLFSELGPHPAVLISFIAGANSPVLMCACA